MKTNFYIESQQFCYGFDEYKIEEFNGRRYIIPVKDSRKRVTAITEMINDAMIDILNIGKKLYYNEIVEDKEILSYARNYGLFGFMSDFSINRYYVLDNEVALRDYNFIVYKDYVTKMDLKEYMKIFMPRSTDKQIETLINKCKKDIAPTVMEKYLTPGLNEYLIFYEDYAEPVDMFLQYAKLLYEALVRILEDDIAFFDLSILRLNNLTNSLDRLTSSGIGIKFNYLKQAIDLNFFVHLTQDTVMLKTCKFCNKAFIATNSKSEYDTPSCKNKANVYKFRSKEEI